MDIKQTAIKFLGAAALACTALSASATTTVVNFDDLQGDGQVANGYGGINWQNNWMYYSDSQDPYNPASGAERIYVNYSTNQSWFSFDNAVVFDGAAVAGVPTGWGYGTGFVSFSLYYQGNLVSTSAQIDPSQTPTFLSSGYSGLVDSVHVNGSNDYYVLDDVTYSTAAVPEPENVALMLAGLALVGGMARRARKA